MSLISTSPLALALAGAVLLSLLVTIINGLRNPLNKVRGPLLARFTNLRLKLAVCSGQRMYYIHQLHETYGPYVRISPNEVAVNDQAGFQMIHKIGSDFPKSDWYRQVTGHTREKRTVFTMVDGKQHAQRRKLFARPFSRTFLLAHWHDTLREMTRLTIDRIRADALRGNADVVKWWTLMAMDVSGRLMYGHSFGNTERGEESDLMRILTTRLKVNGISVELPFVGWFAKVLRLIPHPALQSVFRDNDVLVEYGKNLLSSTKASETSSNIFANMAAEAEKGERLNDEAVQLEASALIVAGSDTTAMTLTYLVYAVLSRPTLQRELEQELATLNDDYTDAQLEKLPLLRAVIEETLRLYGAAPGSLPRMVPAGGATMGGVFLPEGTTVSTQAYSAHRDPHLFPNPYEFIPSRWLSDTLSPAARKAFTPFGAGSRTCLGIHLAYMELRLAAAEFFRKCKGARLKATVTKESMEMENFFLIAPRGHKCEITMA